MKQVLLILMLVVSGCASYPSYSERPDVNTRVSKAALEQAGEAAILVSVTTGMEPGGEVVSPTVYYAAEGDEDDLVHEQLSPYGVMLVPFGRSRHFAGANGKLLVERLKPGKYSLVTWGINNGTGAHIWPRYPLDPLVFEVEAGEIVYLGNAHFMLDTGKNVFGVDITGGAWVEIRDEHKRDLAVAAKMLPKVGPEEIAVKVVDGTPWTLEYVNSKVNTIDSE